MSKKASKPIKENLSYDTRDIVLGKVRGYPPWPGMVVDPESVPSTVLKERPTTKKTQFYCVRFFPTGDFAWLVSKDISRLQQHEIQSYINEPYKKSGDLLQGYRIALDPTKWEEEREAESRLAAEEEANAEVDQLESENDASGDNDDDEVKTKAKPRKRKRDSDAASTSKAKKATKPKKEEVAKRKSTGAAKGRRNGKSVAMVESEEEDADGADATAEGDTSISKKSSPPPAKRAKRDKEEDVDDDKTSKDPEALKVRDWRHKLQKTFLSQKAPPKEEDMPAIDALFTTVEYYDKITIEYLQFSKIGKVMRHISIQPDEKVPRNAEFKFKERADALVKKWHQILNANKPNGSESISAAPALSVGPISAAPLNKGDLTDKQDDVTEGTASINLNGKPEGSTAVPPTNNEKSTEVPGSADVIMSDDA